MKTAIERPRTHPEINEFRRTGLIRATIECLAEYGIERSTVAVICDRAGASRGLIAHYFDSKEDLLVETYESLYRQVLDVTGRAARDRKGDAYEQLKAIARDTHDPNIVDLEMRRAYLVFWTASLTNERFSAMNRKQYQKHRNTFARLFARAAAERQVELDEEAAASGLLALVDGLWLETSINMSDVGHAGAAAACLQYVDRLLRI